MPDQKRPEDVEPAKVGVKIKRKNPPLPKEQKMAQVIPNISPNVPIDQLPTPSENAIKISTQMNIARQRLIKAMKDFNQLLTINILPENFATKDKELERSVIEEVIMAASEIDKISMGEGSLSLSVFAVRQAISFRNAGNRLAYKIDALEKKISALDISSDEELGKQQQVLDLAKKLGIKVKLDSDGK